MHVALTVAVFPNHDVRVAINILDYCVSVAFEVVENQSFDLHLFYV